MSNDVIISVEGLGKKYRIQHQQGGMRYVALRDVIAQKFAAPFKFLHKTTRPQDHETSPLSSSPVVSSPRTEDFWALRDVSFSVRQGEVLGIIGRNGAGKSTLLKILSRITEPTEGRVRIKGRVASLLEVGTGFHAELTGRENIFLNGAILGMHRAEIKRKFDEIVAFSEVEKFLDTPVKRYSSGMYVRLAFAVAAHLEPEILIVDEVLAVGDAEFQKKCLGKMESVARNEGRTVLFVSHNMAVVHSLCSRTIMLAQGSVAFAGTTPATTAYYLQSVVRGENVSRRPRIDGSPTITDATVEVCAVANESIVLVSFSVSSRKQCSVSIEIRLFDNLGAAVGFASAGLLDPDRIVRIPAGTSQWRCRFSASRLARGTYRLTAQIAIPMVRIVDSLDTGLEFFVERPAAEGMQRTLDQSWGYGCIELPLTVELRGVAS